MEDSTIGGRLVRMCIDAATGGAEAVQRWRWRRRALERLPSPLADEIFRRLHRGRLLYPSLLEIFQQSVEEIDLSGENFVDVEWMAYVGGFRNLRRLNLADCRGVNNSGLWPLSGMSCLKELDLSRCSRVTNIGMKHILSITNLESLWISETGVTFEGLLHISALKNLRILDLGGLPVTDEVLSSIQVLTQLEHLNLWGSEISNNGATFLKFFPNLNFLNIAWTRVTKLPNLPSISCLNASNCTISSISDENNAYRIPLYKLLATGVTFLDVAEAFSSVDTETLSFLDLSSSSISDLHFVDNMKGLEHLNFSFCWINDASIQHIAHVGSSLRSLSLSNTKITTVGVDILAGNVPNLETLSLSRTEIDDHSCLYISTMPKMRVLDLSGTRIKGFFLDSGDTFSLNALQSLNKLESLNLEETLVQDEKLKPLLFFRELENLQLKSDYLSDTAFRIVSSLPKLAFVGFRCGMLTNSALISFTPRRALRLLDLRGCWLLTVDAISNFCAAHPGIEMRHELAENHKSDQSRPGSVPRSKPDGAKLSRASGEFSRPSFIVDERLKYSMEELLGFQHEPTVSLASSLHQLIPKELRRN